LIRFMFEDDEGVRPLAAAQDHSIKDAVLPIKVLVENRLTALSEEDLDVVFWVNEAGLLKMSLRGDNEVVERARDLIGNYAPVPPIGH
jgi:hypothetical protein